MHRVVNASLHEHLRTSSTVKYGDLDRVVELAQKRLGSGAVIGMINFDDARYEGLSKSAVIYSPVDLERAVYVPEKDVLIYKGQEVPTEQGHLLVLSLPKNVFMKSGKSLEYSLDEAKDLGGIAIADHPFFRDGLGPYLKGNPHLLKQFQGIEIESGESYLGVPGLLPEFANEKAQSWFEEISPGFPKLAGLRSTDGHSFYELGRISTRILMPENYSEIKSGKQVNKALKEGLIANEDSDLSGTKTKNIDKIRAICGALDHSLDLAVIKGLSKMGIKIPFESKIV